MRVIYGTGITLAQMKS